MPRTLAQLAAHVSALHATEEKFDTDEYDGAVFALWSALTGAHRDVLRQVLKAPTYDGNICSKSARNDLIEAGLAVRCCVNFEQGYTTATYLAGSIWRVMQEHS